MNHRQNPRAVFQRFSSRQFSTIPDKLKNRNGELGEAPVMLAETFRSRSTRPAAVNSTATTFSVDDNELPRSADQSAPTPIEPKEVEAALRAKRPRSAPGTDGINYLILQRTGATAINILTSIFNRCLTNGTIPDEWNVGAITPIFKSGSKVEANNYRPISLLNCGRKLFEAVLAKRLSDHIEEVGGLHPAQGGFRPGRTTIMQMLVVDECIARARDQNKTIEQAALDIQGAYDSVDREEIIKGLERMGVHKAYITLVQRLIHDCKYFVRVGDQRSDQFTLDQGVPQGSSISPLLFLVAIDSLLRWLEKAVNDFDLEVPEVGGIKIFVLMFADDVYLLAFDQHSMRVLLQVCETHSIAKYYRWYPRKCEGITFQGSKQRPDPNYQIYNQPITMVRSARYLGGIMNQSGLSTKLSLKHAETRVRAKLSFLAWKGCFGQDTPINLSRIIINQVLRPAVDYAASLLDPKLATSADVVIRSAIRKTLAANNLMPNEAVYAELGIWPLQDRIRLANIKLFIALSNPDCRHELIKQIRQHPHQRQMKKRWSRKFFFERTRSDLKQLLGRDVEALNIDLKVVKRCIQEKIQSRLKTRLQDVKYTLVHVSKYPPGFNEQDWKRLGKRAMIGILWAKYSLLAISWNEKQNGVPVVRQPTCIFCQLIKGNWCDITSHWIWECNLLPHDRQVHDRMRDFRQECRERLGPTFPNNETERIQRTGDLMQADSNDWDKHVNAKLSPVLGLLLFDLAKVTRHRMLQSMRQ